MIKMLLKELFERDGVECPEWLSNELLEDGWKESVYANRGRYHVWTLKNQLQNSRISFDGKKYHFKAFDEDEKILLFEQIITKEFELIT